MIDGLVTLQSRHSAKETADRLAATVVSRGMMVLARIDHAAAAAKVGLDLRPTEVIFFGNPAAGTLLMQNVQTIGLDLPLKALVWQDQSDGVWISYLDVKWLSQRYALTTDAAATVEKIASLLKAVIEEVAQ
ncbi:DUF302 domain-containing protein [Hyphomicrobium sp.]|uniref:DUF302 domain-containing protein n=1 Tax=Hyphomicrobium sp. TaxID=82 RepID=UPI000FAEAA13|nr:DUF302 domain-containing protein [Hyphomicrobium sp.]RUO97419.1 MAG: DUF302 domain-containing protein [Hyphomicrobium sp.]